MHGIQFHELVPVRWFRNRRNMKVFLAGLFKREKVKWASLDIIFCDDEYLLRINRQYLQHEDYTDIITFDLAESRKRVAGEIYISIERVLDNARQLGVTRTDELRRVIFHGCLHLCGYKDKTGREKTEMRAKEDEYMARYAVKGST